MQNNSNLNIRISYEDKVKAQNKARAEGLSLSTLVKCFIVGYISGDILASELLASIEKKQ